MSNLLSCETFSLLLRKQGVDQNKKENPKKEGGKGGNGMLMPTTKGLQALPE
jgi:hypothetical protein